MSISPFLWFHDDAEAAAEFYVATVPNSRIVHVQRMGEDGPVFMVSFVIDGLEVQALNGAPAGVEFTDGFSFFLGVETQAEIDRLWDALTSDGGEPGRCGWLKDRWGLSWQIVPGNLGELLGPPDPDKAARAMQVMLGMGKLDIAALRNA